MSWEGYGQALCEKGHQYFFDAYDSEAECTICRSNMAWSYMVDLTNGCDEDCGEGAKCYAHPIPLTLKNDAEFHTCPTCQHKEILTHPTYEIPKRTNE